VDFAYAAHVKIVVRDAHDWSGTPVGRFLVVDKLPARDFQVPAEPKGWAGTHMDHGRRGSRSKL